MKRWLQTGMALAAALLLAGSAASGAQKANPKKMAPPPGAREGAAPKGTPKAPGGGPRLNNPANQFERLLAMPPEKRDQVLEKLPPAQQERLRARLDQFDKLPPQQKALRLEMLNRYYALPPERQQAYSQQVQAFNNLPAERRPQIVRELRSLWRLPEAERQTRLNSEDYKTRFSPAELKMLNEISAANLLAK